MIPVLERTFGTWLDLSRNAEVLALLSLVKAALARPRGYVVALAVEKIPRAEGSASQSRLRSTVARGPGRSARPSLSLALSE